VSTVSGEECCLTAGSGRAHEAGGVEQQTTGPTRLLEAGRSRIASGSHSRSLLAAGTSVAMGRVVGALAGDWRARERGSARCDGDTSGGRVQVGAVVSGIEEWEWWWWWCWRG
jgi:hypothetical protein